MSGRFEVVTDLHCTHKHADDVSMSSELNDENSQNLSYLNDDVTRRAKNYAITSSSLVGHVIYELRTAWKVITCIWCIFVKKITFLRKEMLSFAIKYISRLQRPLQDFNRKLERKTVVCASVAACLSCTQGKNCPSHKKQFINFSKLPDFSEVYLTKYVSTTLSW